MKAGLATIALRRYDVFHALDLAAEAGFGGVEIWGKPSHTPEEFDEDHTRKVRDRARANGLKICMFGSYARPMLPDFEQKADDALMIAKILGTRRIRVWAGNKEPHEADEELWSFVVGKLKDFALRAEDEGITLAMEMHSGTLTATPEGAVRLIEQSKAPNLRLNYQVVDPKNPDLERVIGLVGDYVVNVHAQNYRASAVDPANVEISRIDEGMIDYKLALDLLAAHGFGGFVEVEFLKGENVSEQVMLESLKRDAEYLNGLTGQYQS